MNKEGVFLFKKKQILPKNIQNHIYNIYFDKVFKVALSVTRDSKLAEDVCQETFLICFEKYYQLRDPEKTGPWLTTITLNTARALLKEHNRIIPISLNDILETKENNVYNPEFELEKQEIHDLFIGLIFQLPIEFQEVIILKYYHDLEVREIADLLDIPEGTIKSRLNRARQKLKSHLENEEIFPKIGGSIK